MLVRLDKLQLHYFSGHGYCAVPHTTNQSTTDEPDVEYAEIPAIVDDVTVSDEKIDNVGVASKDVAPPFKLPLALTVKEQGVPLITPSAASTPDSETASEFPPPPPIPTTSSIPYMTSSQPLPCMTSALPFPSMTSALPLPLSPTTPFLPKSKESQKAPHMLPPPPPPPPPPPIPLVTLPQIPSIPPPPLQELNRSSNIISSSSKYTMRIFHCDAVPKDKVRKLL